MALKHLQASPPLSGTRVVAISKVAGLAAGLALALGAELGLELEYAPRELVEREHEPAAHAPAVHEAEQGVSRCPLIKCRHCWREVAAPSGLVRGLEQRRRLLSSC